MRYLKMIFIVCTISFIFGTVSCCLAATKEDVIVAINKTYVVGKEKFRLPQKIINKGESYLKKHPLTSEEYDKILICIDNAVALAREIGTTDITKISKKDRKRALNILVEAARTAKVDLNKELAENNIQLDGESQVSDNSGDKVNEPPNNPESEKVGNNSNIKSDKEEIVGQPQSEPNVNIKEENPTKVDNTIPNDSFEKASPENTKLQTNVDHSSGDNSGNPLSGDGNEKQQNVVDKTTENDIEEWEQQGIKNEIEKYMKIVVAVVVGILIILFFILYLLLRIKKYKIIKYILFTLNVIAIFVLIVFLAIFLYDWEEISLMLQLYTSFM